MKKLWLCTLVVLVSLCVSAQTVTTLSKPYSRSLNAATSTGDGLVFVAPLEGGTTPAQWTMTTAVTGYSEIQIQLLGSINNSNWFVLATSTSITGESTSAAGVASFVKCTIVSKTGTGTATCDIASSSAATYLAGVTQNGSTKDVTFPAKVIAPQGTITGTPAALTDIDTVGARNSAMASLFPTVPFSTYGAKCDQRVVNDAAITSGASTLTSATAAFTSADTGKIITVAMGTGRMVWVSYISGLTPTGTKGQTCSIAVTNGGGSGATATVALTGTNAIASGTRMAITAVGSGFTSSPTAGTASNGTATCSGTAVLTTLLMYDRVETTGTYVNATTMTLATPSTSTVSSAYMDIASDDTAAFNAWLTAVAWGGTQHGGAIYLPGRCLIDGQVITVPNNGNNDHPVQYPLRITGKGSSGDLLGLASPSPSALDFRYPAAVAAIDTRGVSTFSIDNVGIENNGPNDVTLIHTTNTALMIDVAAFKNKKTSDSIILGGYGTSTSGNTADNMFQGYGTNITRTYFINQRYAVVANQATNGVEITGNIVSQSQLTGPTGLTGRLNAPFLAQGNGVGYPAATHYSGNTVETNGGYAYAFSVINGALHMNFEGNSIWDPAPETVGCYNFETDGNNIYGGFCDAPIGKVIDGGYISGTNFWPGDPRQPAVIQSLTTSGLLKINPYATPEGGISSNAGTGVGNMALHGGSAPNKGFGFAHGWSPCINFGGTSCALEVLNAYGPTYPPVTFATLPACGGATAPDGSTASVTDSTTAIWGATITGGGTNHQKAYCNGTNWTVD